MGWVMMMSRFLSNTSDLWSRVIKNIYGADGGINAANSRCSGLKRLETGLPLDFGMIFGSVIIPIHDWSVFLRRHPRGGIESSQLEALQAAIGNVVLTDQRDSGKWSLDVSHGFSVASVRSLVDARTLDVDSNATRWIRCIPIKINMFLWRLSLNKLPSKCEMAKALWDLFAKWWELDIPFCDNIFNWFTWLDSLKVSNKALLWDSIVSQSFL
ncbi:hypothetical protein Tco_1448585 [Tanacetum coccineum]